MSAVQDRLDLPMELDATARALVEFSLTSLLDAVLLLDGGGLAEQASPAALADLGLTPDEVIGVPLERILGIHVGELDRPGARTITEGTYDGRQVRWRATSLADARVDGGWLLQFQLDATGSADLTERAARLEDLLDDLSERFETLNRYVGLISHDLQAPARRLLSFVELLRDDLDGVGSQVVEERLEAIVKGANHMLRLTSELLQYSRLGKRPIPLGPVDADEVLRHTIEQLELDLDAAGATVRVATPLPRVTASPTYLSVVFQNLIENAVDFAREGVPAEVDISWNDAGADVRILVTDNGIGIDPDLREAIFQPFRRLNPGPARHTGLGLATVRDLIERFGGRIQVSWSEPGAGTTFAMLLPKA